MVKHVHYQKEQNRFYGSYVCCDAAKMRTAEDLMYVHDVLGLPWDASTCKAAAICGSIDCLSYAHASGCPWDQSICVAAAGFGRLDCLAYAHEQ